MTDYKSIIESKKTHHYKKQEIEKFWVGLMDSAGCIQCNHCKKTRLQFRIVIHAQIDNISMLNTIKYFIGGHVRFLKNNDVVWVINHEREIIKLCKIFDRYPPLTTRIQCQLAFLKKCALRKDVEWYLQNRDHKYKLRKKIKQEISAQDIKQFDYFPIWLSGFITGTHQPCFFARTPKKDFDLSKATVNNNFSIAQKDDDYIIKSIRDFFSGKNKVQSLKNDLFVWQTYHHDTLKAIIDHCNCFPLLGKKAIQLDELRKIDKQLSSSKEFSASEHDKKIL